MNTGTETIAVSVIAARISGAATMAEVMTAATVAANTTTVTNA